MRFLVSNLSDDQANTFLDPYNDIGHYNGTYMINTDDRYGLHSDAWRNESMSIINPDYGLRVGAYIDWTEDVEEQEAITMDIYPNPAIDQINVSLEDHQDASFEIFNLLGEVVKSTQLTSQNTQVDVSGLSHGTYIVRVISGEKTATKKVIISH
ncbi:MAG: T9SS type A sorting domain-containing protein [Bacteroidales bacterium]